jgi:NADH pyrophosphatase NudC (nudix superfamily)
MNPPKYCRFCGKPLVPKTLLDGSVEQYCPVCDRVFFDEPSPAVIVAVVNAGKILLTRSVDWKHQYWGLIAGHVKSGETAEEAAIREVQEEVGLQIHDLMFCATFALDSRGLLMIGFKAATEDKKVTMSQELEKAQWFKLDEPLPLRPCSVAHQLASRVYPSIRLAEAEI